MRRIITGHNDNGKSVISIEGPPARSIGEEAGGLYEIWNTDGSGFDTTSNEDRADIDIVLSPVQKGTKFRYFQINPIPEGVPQEAIEAATAEAFEKIGAAPHRVDTSRNAAMPGTNTIASLILLKGDGLVPNRRHNDSKPRRENLRVRPPRERPRGLRGARAAPWERSTQGRGIFPERDFSRNPGSGAPKQWRPVRSCHGDDGV